jgi:hypothetical protein
MRSAAVASSAGELRVYIDEVKFKGLNALGEGQMASLTTK